MISSPTSISAPDVARHYDELDYFYRKVWGEHVHHGFWSSPSDLSSVEEATVRLLKEVTEVLALQKGSQVADIGCGYGASARWVAARHGAHVEAFTLSQQQHSVALHAPPVSHGQITIRLCDWLENTLSDNSLDAAYAIESLAHMPDKKRFFAQLQRTLKPGGQASLACWLTAPDLNALERSLMRIICQEGRLPGMGTFHEYEKLIAEAGLELISSRDCSRQVERTWWIISQRVLKGLFTDCRYTTFLLNRAFRERVFILTLPRLLLAYLTRAMAYGLFYLRKPFP